MARRIVPSAPAQRRIERNAPIDTTGMDPEMAKTLTQERNRKGILETVAGAFGKGRASAPKPKKK
jgi:hypothetical protein